MKNIFFILAFLSVFRAESQILATMNHDGIDRTYNYYIPSDWTQGQQLPLLIVLHGLTQTGSGVMDITAFNAIAEDNKFIVCYPSGINNAWNANMNVSVSTADDKGFIEKLVHYFRDNFGTDPMRQYLSGFSNGGFMSHKMACESNECFAAIATVSGNMSDTTYADCAPHYRTSVLHIHGTGDAVVPYSGGPATGVSVEATLEKWRSFLGCTNDPTTVSMPNNNLLDLSTADDIIYHNCSQSALEHIRVNAGGHQWPGINTWVGGVGTVNMDFYSPQVIWDFLKTKSCPNAGLNSMTMDKFKYNSILESTFLLESDQPLKFECWNTIGQKVFDGESNDPIDVSNLKSGIYFLNLNIFNKENCKIKLIKI